MKTNDEIRRITRLTSAETGADGGRGYLYGLDAKRPQKPAVVVWSWGDGWDHVSVSFYDRCPTWDEMCRVKDLFFYPEEMCVEYHPAHEDYVNIHPHCLHIWRKQDGEMPKPPKYMV